MYMSYTGCVRLSLENKNNQTHSNEQKEKNLVYQCLSKKVEFKLKALVNNRYKWRLDCRVQRSQNSHISAGLSRKSDFLLQNNDFLLSTTSATNDSIFYSIASLSVIWISNEVMWYQHLSLSQSLFLTHTRSFSLSISNSFLNLSLPFSLPLSHALFPFFFFFFLLLVNN